MSYSVLIISTISGIPIFSHSFYLAQFSTTNPFLVSGTAVGTVGNRCEVHVLVKGLVDPVQEINRFLLIIVIVTY